MQMISMKFDADPRTRRVAPHHRHPGKRAWPFFLEPQIQESAPYAGDEFTENIFLNVPGGMVG